MAEDCITDEDAEERDTQARETLAVAVQAARRFVALSDIERGTRSVTAIELARLAEVLDVDMHTLVYGEPSDAPAGEYVQVPSGLTATERREVRRYAEFLLYRRKYG